MRDNSAQGSNIKQSQTAENAHVWDGSGGENGEDEKDKGEHKVRAEEGVLCFSGKSSDRVLEWCFR